MKIKKCIYLIGFMASGKSTVGKLLADSLGFLFMDIDSIIEKKEGAPIFELFQQKGEKYFRESESSELKDLVPDDNTEGMVISTGGGLPCNPENLAFMKGHGILVYLKTGIDDIIQRIGDISKRPVFQGLMQNGKLRKSVERLLTEREKYYNQADIIVANSNKVKPETAAEQIMKKIQTLK